MYSEPNVKKISNTDKISPSEKSLEAPFVLARVFFGFGAVLITFECLFYNKIIFLIKGLGLPVILWPSEIWFICIGGILFMFHVINRGMRVQIKDFKPIIIIVVVFLIALLHGLLNHNHYALRDFREICLGAFALPTVMILSPYYNLRKNPKKIILFFLFIGITFTFIVIYETANMIHFNPIKSNAFTMFLFLGLPFLVLANFFQVKMTFLPLIVVSAAILINFSKLTLSNFFFVTVISCICLYFITPKFKFLKLNKIRTKMLLKLGALVITSLVFLFVYDLYTNGGIQNAILVSFIKLRSTANGELYFGNLSGGRIDIWKASINLWLERPLIGHGLGKTVSLYSSGWIEKFQLHNYFLQLLQNIGLIGMLIVVSCFLFWLKKYLLN